MAQSVREGTRVPSQKIARCVCCMRITNEWAIANWRICERCHAHGAFVLDVAWNKRMDRPFGEDTVWVGMCNEAPEMKNQQVRFEDLLHVAEEVDMREMGSPGGGGLADPGSGVPTDGHFSGFLSVDGDRRSLAAAVPHRDARGRRYFDTPDGRKYVEEA